MYFQVIWTLLVEWITVLITCILLTAASSLYVRTNLLCVEYVLLRLVVHHVLFIYLTLALNECRKYNVAMCI